MNQRPSVDVIIPTYKPDASFGELIVRLQRQSYPIDHILIINTEEKYWNPDLIVNHEGVEVFHIEKKQFDHGATRRKAEGFSIADILIYMTQDAMPVDAGLIRQLVRAFRNPNVKAAYARQLPREDSRIIEGFTRSFNYPDKSRIKGKEDIPTLGIKTYFCSNVCAAYDHETYKALGGFPKRAIFNEDMIYAGNLVQAGYDIAYVAEAQVIHSHNYSNGQQFKRNFDLGVSQAEHPEIFKGVPSEGEGFRLVKKTANYLKKIDRGNLIPGLIISSAFKFLGYRLGKIYRFLPRWLVKACSMNKSYWYFRAEEDE